MTTPRDRWDSAYTGDTPAPWDTGRPQPAFEGLADRGLLAGHVLDAGCGTGEHSLLAAALGADVVGVDFSPVAIARAKAKAAERGLSVRFEVGSALELGALELGALELGALELGALEDKGFDVVIDSGLFHTFDDSDRPRYVDSLASVLRPGGTLYLMCFSDLEPGDFGPRRVSQDELRAAFSEGWSIAAIEAEKWELAPGWLTAEGSAWLATIRRA